MKKNFYILLSVFCILGIACLSALPEKTKIKTIVFDFGGVIAQSDREEIVQFIAKSLNIPLNEGYESLALLKAQTAKGKTESQFWLDYAYDRQLNLPANWQQELDDVRLHSTKAIPGMIELVKDLQKQGFQTALLSNVRESQAKIKRRLGYYDLFQPQIFSYEIGVSKPDVKAYQLLLEQLKKPADEVLFIDNKLVNVEVAKSQGMDAIQFTTASQLIKELKQRGIHLSNTL